MLISKGQGQGVPQLWLIDGRAVDQTNLFRWRPRLFRHDSAVHTTNKCWRVRDIPEVDIVQNAWETWRVASPRINNIRDYIECLALHTSVKVYEILWSRKPFVLNDTLVVVCVTLAFRWDVQTPRTQGHLPYPLAV